MLEQKKNIRVLHVVTFMGRGGIETMLMNYYRQIDRSKIQFDFLVHRNFEAAYDAEIRELGGKIYHVSRLVPWSLSYKNELKNFFREHPEYKIVHVHQDCLSSVALKCAKECGIPVRIAHSHSSSQNKNWKYIIKRHYMKYISKYATELLACGVAAGNWMFQGKSYKVIQNAIDINKYSLSEEERLEIKKEYGLLNHTVIGHVGNFSPTKNHGFLLDIFARIVKKDENARLLLIGGGNEALMKKYKDKACELQIDDKVQFLGVRADVDRLMQCMDVFVFPSLFEGLPVSMIEAQASGVPCVISDFVPQECIITDGLVTTMKLSDLPRTWADHILMRAKEPRVDRSQEIRKSGYDVQTEAKNLEHYYLEKIGEE